MNQDSKLTAALKELSRVTGVELQLNIAAGDEAFALKQLQCLTAAYKEKYNKTQFLYRLMTDSSFSYDIHERASKFHISLDEPRVLYLIHTRSNHDDTTLEILKHLFPSQTKTYLVPVDETTLAILRPLHTETSVEALHDEIEQTAHMIVDTLNTEALTFVQVAYSFVFPHLQDLHRAFDETLLALKVGKLFASEQTVFPYNKLGAGRLIYQLPTSVCEQFLMEIFGEQIPDSLDPDALLVIDRFLQNNLNIAETARQLHMHRNTLIYRLEQVEKQTHLDLRHFEDAMTFKIASMVLNYLHNKNA